MKNIKDLIKELCPDGVEYKKLGEIAEISRGGNFQKKDFCDSGIPCIHYGQIYTKLNFFTDTVLTYISKEIAENQKFAEKNDIVMAVTSENIEDVCKCVAWLGEEKIAVSGHSVIIHHNQNPKYLSYYFHSEMFYNQKRKLAHGTKVIEMTPDEIKNIEIPFPPLEIQQEIAEILSTQDKIIELKQKLINQKKLQKKYLMQNLLTKKIRLRGFEGEWKKVKLGDMCEIRGGGTPDTSNIEYWNGNIPWISSSDLKENDIFHINIKKYITKEAVRNSSTKICPENSILLVSRVGVGKIAVSNCEICTSQDFTNIVKFNADKLYLTYTLYQRMQMELNNLQGTSIKGITLKEIKNFVLNFPPVEEQTAIAEILSTQDKEIELLEKELDFQKQIKKALMQTLFSGK